MLSLNKPCQGPDAWYSHIDIYIYIYIYIYIRLVAAQEGGEEPPPQLQEVEATDKDIANIHTYIHIYVV
jgi:hypothetical protein